MDWTFHLTCILRRIRLKIHAFLKCRKCIFALGLKLVCILINTHRNLRNGSFVFPTFGKGSDSGFLKQWVVTRLSVVCKAETDISFDSWKSKCIKSYWKVKLSYIAPLLRGRQVSIAKGRPRGTHHNDPDLMNAGPPQKNWKRKSLQADKFIEFYGKRNWGTQLCLFASKQTWFGLCWKSNMKAKCKGHQNDTDLMNVEPHKCFRRHPYHKHTDTIKRIKTEA